MNRTKLLTLLAFCCSAAWAQTDTLFWFAAPEVTKSNSNWDRPILFRITSYAAPAIITVSQPANAWFPTYTDTVPAGSTVDVDLTAWIDSIENKPADTILNYGLRIGSTTPITVYYEVVSAQCQCQPEIFALKGQTALGDDFWIPSQTLIDNNQNPSPITNSSFDLVATEDNTSITITPAKGIVGHSAGIPFIITLNRGQTYSAMAVSGLASEHLNGSRVVSDKPIAITIKDDSIRSLIYGTCTDLGGDQIVPADVLGTEYIAINGFLNSIGDQLFVMAVQDDTQLSQNGVVVDTLSAGETTQLDVGDSSTYLQSSLPVSVLQVSGYNCEMGIDILPQIICTGSDSIAVARSTAESFFVNVLVPSGGQGSFLVNGAPGVIDGALFKQVPGTNGQWYSGQTSLSTTILPVGSAALISNPIMPFHLSVIHGGPTTGARFGYFSDFDCPLNVGASEPDGRVTRGIRVFPNPSSAIVLVDFGNEMTAKALSLLDATGRLILTQSITNASAQITLDLSAQENGLYFVQVELADGRRTVQRVVKQ